ncbi:MAG TPA: hypothetical protein DET40_08670 [Lentisphaeria bacterium]|nr:MAG: hypothetical protein A2X45_19345 [Lentisphaerae bacterium GWF2_50_93]HCE43608.1 hypothetical protein [Lentisphaeria bacterium]
MRSHFRIIALLSLSALILLSGLRGSGQEAENPVKPASVEQTAGKNVEKAVIQPGENIELYWDKVLDRLKGNFHFENLTAKDIIMFFGCIALTLLIARFSRWFLEHYAAKMAKMSETEVDDLVFAAVGKPVSMIIFAIGFYFSASLIFPLMSGTMIVMVWKLCTAIFAIAMAWAAYRLVSVVDHLVGTYAKRSDNDLDDLVVPAISRTLKTVVVVFSVLLIGQNIFNLNITTLLAGAGVAGLAVAFAAQDTIANVFGSIMVIVDQPFKAGEIIKVDAITGQVEQIGFRSTKIRTLNGHLVTIPNKNMANAVIENISKRPYIKHEMNLTLVYGTSPESMEKAVRVLHDIFDNHENMNKEFPPKIFFNSFKDWSLNIYIILWFNSSDYFAFLDWSHRKNLEILKRFNEEDIEFAFPTQTTILATDSKHRPEIIMPPKDGPA